MKKQKGRIRSMAALAVLAVVGVLGIGGTYGWNQHEAEVENVLQSRNAGVEIVEEFPDPKVTPGGTKTKKVSFKNNGTAAVFLRVAVSEHWDNSSQILSGETLPTKNWTTAWSTEWELGTDGWYYYKKILPAGADTETILNSITFPSSCPPDANYRLEFLAETVQASDEAAVNTAATQAAFGRSGTITGMTTQQGAVTGGTVTWH